MKPGILGIIGSSKAYRPYAYKKTITIDYTKCGTVQSTDFPVCVSFTDSAFATVSNGGRIRNSNGYDINFYSDISLTTALKYETERYIPTTGECIFWVKVPTLSVAANTVIYVGYSNIAISAFQGNVTGTWNSNYKGVWHLPDGTTLTANDSTASPENGTPTGNYSATTGKVGGGVSFTSTKPGYINVPHNSKFNITSAITVSCWMKTSTTTRVYIVTKHDDSFYFGVGPLGSTANKLSFYIGGVSAAWLQGSTNVGDGTMRYVAATWNGSTITVYINGVSDGSIAKSGTITTGTASMTFGARFDNTETNVDNGFNGNVDELRIANTALSASWLLAEYNNQSSPSTFFTLGSEVPA